jgi:hypothetical protein
MNIEKAHVNIEDGYPILDLIIDGRPAAVIDPKQNLLDAGVVVLVDVDGKGYWQQFAAMVSLDGEPEVLVPGGIRNADLVALAQRFANGETGNLLTT